MVVLRECDEKECQTTLHYINVMLIYTGEYIETGRGGSPDWLIVSHALVPTAIAPTHKQRFLLVFAALRSCVNASRRGCIVFPPGEGVHLVGWWGGGECQMF